MLLNQKLEYFILVVFINMVPLAFAQETDNTDSTIAQSGSMNAMPILPPMPDPVCKFQLISFISVFLD